jgi:hypothetical protein
MLSLKANEAMSLLTIDSNQVYEHLPILDCGPLGGPAAYVGKWRNDKSSHGHVLSYTANCRQRNQVGFPLPSPRALCE